MYIIFTYFISLMIEHMEDIIGLLFRYIALLQTSGTRQWIFDEVNFGFGFVYLLGIDFFFIMTKINCKLYVTSV